MHLALFDFDGTITTKDSLIEFLKFSMGASTFYKGLITLSPILVAYKLGLIKNSAAKQKLISYFFKGWSLERFQNICDDYSLNQIDKIVRPEAKARIAWHKKQGHRIVVVSASIENWLYQWCKREEIELKGTKLELENSLLTGKFSTPNCFGQEKVNRVLSCFNLEEYESIYAYGDSKGDAELLTLATHRYYRKFE